MEIFITLTKYNTCISVKKVTLQAGVVSILLYGYTIWTLTKRMEEKAWRQLHKNAASNIEQVRQTAHHKAAAASHLPLITTTIKIRQTRHAGTYWRSRDDPVSDVLLSTSSHGRAKAGRSARTYTHQLCDDTGCNPEDLPKAMDDRDGWRERVRNIHADSAIWRWWWYNSILCHEKLLKSGIVRDKSGSNVFRHVAGQNPPKEF